MLLFAFASLGLRKTGPQSKLDRGIADADAGDLIDGEEAFARP